MSKEWKATRSCYNTTVGHLTINGFEYNQVTDYAAVKLAATAPKLLDALKKAELFISGFEEDEIQENIEELLSVIRDIIREAEYK